MFNYAYLAKDESHALEFANEFTVLDEAKKRNFKHVLSLDGILLGISQIALRVPKWDMTLRDYLGRMRNKF